MPWIWEIQVIDSCLVHGCSLIDHCNTCDSQLSWTNGNLMECWCGAPLCDMRTVPVGPIRITLDKLLADNLNSIANDKFGRLGSTTEHLASLKFEQSFCAVAVIAFHVVPQISRAIKLNNVSVRNEQEADFTLRIISLDRPGIEEALFGVLANDLCDLDSSERAWILCQNAHSRLMSMWKIFNLNWHIQNLQFVHHVLLPAWDEVHRKWRGSVDQSWIEYIDSCDPMITQRHEVLVRRRQFQRRGIWRD